eukprot:jgi/Mesen1/11052/ME000099S10502
MEQLEQLLAQFLVPDNAQRKQAEEHIKQLGRDPGIVPALMHLVSSSQQPNIRQLAAVLLRKRITGHWMKLSEDVKTSIKSVLLEIIVHDSRHVIRAYVVSVVAKHTVPAGQWPALLPFLMQCSQSQEEDHREQVSLMLFSSLTETIGEMLLPHFGSLQAVFLRGLQDSQSGRVRLAALKCALDPLISVLVASSLKQLSQMKMRELIGPILEVARHCIAHGEEEAALRAFEIFDDLVESPAPILGPALPAIFTFALEQAAQMVGWMARWKPKAVQKHRLAPPALAVLLPLLAEADAHAGDTAADVPASAFAGQVVDVMCQSLPSKAVLPSVLAFAHLCSGSAAAREREAGLVALAISAEGYSEVLKKKLLELVPLVLKGLADGEQRVRGAACFALGQLAEYVQPEMSQQYELVLPAIFRVLHDPNPEAQEKAYYALATFCENLGEEIVPYLAALMQSLLEGLNRPQRDLQDMCLLLSPEANRIFEMAMGVYLRAVEEDDDKETVAQACTAMGEVIRLAGPVYVHPYAKRVCDAVLSVLQGEAMCQVSADDEADQALEDEEGEGEGSEHEEVLLDAATELLPALASALGPSLAPLFQGKAARPAGERTTAIAAIAEVGKEIGAAIAPYCSDVLPVVVRELRDEDAANRRNAAFCAGVLCQHGADKAIPFYNNLLVALHPLFGEDEEDAVRDNGVGAVARMISAQPLVVPLEQVLPVMVRALPLREDHEEAAPVYGALCSLISASHPQVLPVMVRALPLREDHEEAAPVYGALCSLISASHPQILPLIPQLVPIFAQVATTPEVSAEVKHAIGAAMRHLVGHFAAETEAIVGTLPQEQAAALASFMPPPR